MKSIIGLVAAILVLYASFSSTTAAVSRSTLWFLSDSLVYSSGKGYQPCGRLASTVNTSLLTTSYFRITSGSAADALYYKTLGGASATGNRI